MTLVFNTLPDTATLLAATRQHRRIAVCLPDKQLPHFASNHPCPSENNWAESLNRQTACLQWLGANVLYGLPNHSELWLMPPALNQRLSDYFGRNMVWANDPLPQQPATPCKPWFAPPPPAPVGTVAVIGAGIAGAATARALAERGVQVIVLEAAAHAASCASGNRQGLLYAKISPHPTEQTELLLCGYGHTRRLLSQYLPDSNSWHGCGVLHLDHQPEEQQRNQALARQTDLQHLFRYLSAEEASRQSGLSLEQGGLFWPHGVWLNPPALVNALLDHPNIALHTSSPLLTARHDAGLWQLDTPQRTFTASHLVYCTGAHSKQQAPLSHLPLFSIRGQTSLAAATPLSARLRTALSGASYISPAWEGVHCYGASFIHHDNDADWREAEDEANAAALAALHPELAASLRAQPSAATLRGHAAIRCDSPDHLPTVGPLGDTAAMQRVYAKLALDKHYRLSDPCPYVPNVYINTAHGSRGLATAPLCAESIAANILGLPDPLSPRLRAALHPNRHTIRAIIRHQPLLAD